MATAAPVAGTTGSVVLRNPTTGTPMYGAGNTATPTGAVSNASGYTVGNTQYSNTGQQVGGPTPSGTMTTTFSNPSTQQNTGAPAVITSSQAQNQIAQIQTKLQQLNGDVQAHNAAQTPAQSQDTTKPQTAPAQTTQNANQPSTGSQTQTSQDPIQTKIDSLLDSLDLGSSKNASTYQPQEDKINNAIVQNQQGYDDSYAQTATQLQQIAQGVYPLSANEQQLLAATASQFQSALTAQETANKAYTGQMTELMASLGINTSAPTQAVGNIQAAISQGNQQITDLNSKMALSLAQLQEGFQQQDYQMVYQNWQMTSGHFQQRQQTLQDLLTNVTNEQKNAQDELQQRTTMGLTALMDDNTISYQTKELALNQAQLNETTRHDMAQELAANPNSPQSQGKLFQQGVTDLKSELSNRSGGLGLQDAKVNQAIHLKALFDQYAKQVQVPTQVPTWYGERNEGTHAQTEYDIPPSAYTELAIGVANLVSGSNTVAEGTINNIKQATAAGDLGKALTYATGEPYNGSSRAVLQQLKDSVDRQATTAEGLRQTYVNDLIQRLPPGLSPENTATLTNSAGLNSYYSPKEQVDNYIQSNPSSSEAVAKLYDAGWSDQDVSDYLNQAE